MIINLRLLKKRKAYLIVSLVGLSLSITFTGLIYLYLKFELGFDKFNSNQKLIYRVETALYSEYVKDRTDPYLRIVELPAPLISVIQSEVPSIEFLTRLKKSYKDGVLKFNDKVFSEKITYVDQDFFRMFSFKLLFGDKNSCLKTKSSIVLTQKKAYKYFGEQNPIGKLVSLDLGSGAELFEVTGIIEDPPANSSIEFGVLLPLEAWPNYEEYNTLWNEYTYSLFVQLRKNTPVENFKATLDQVTYKAMKDQNDLYKATNNIPPGITKIFEATITPLSDVHWNTKIPWAKTTNPSNLKIISGIAIIILLLASINYISIALVQSPRRKTEVGIRKIYGATFSKLSFQFILESLGQTMLAGLVGVALLVILLPSVSNLVDIHIDFGISLIDIFALIALVVFIAIVAGSYPSFFLSSLSPADVLKSRVTYKVKTWLISGLVIIQFALFLFLGISSVYMLQEMNFINTKDLGYNKSQIIVIPTFGDRSETNQIVEQFKQRAVQDSKVISVCGTSRAFFKGISNMGYVDGRGERKSAKAYSVDSDYLKTLQISLLQGRDFDPKSASDINSVIINEQLATEIAPKTIGNYFQWGGSSDSSKIIGIVKGFHYRSFEFPIEPLFLTTNYEKAGPLATLLVRISFDEMAETIFRLKGIWKEINPNRPFEFEFLEDEVQKQYESYQRWTDIMTIATVFASIIAFLGLFGLAGINTVNRYYEVGIRRVFGASSYDVMLLLNRQYGAVIAISAIIAAPASNFALQKWTNSFVYTLPVSIWNLTVYSVLLGTIVVVAAVSYHSLKASFSNPSDTIRYE